MSCMPQPTETANRRRILRPFQMARLSCPLLFSLLSCSPAGKSGKQSLHTRTESNRATISAAHDSTSASEMDAQGNVTFLEGWTASEFFQSANADDDQSKLEDQENLRLLLENDAPLFAYEAPVNAVVKYSEPQLLQQGSLSLSGAPLSCDSGIKTLEASVPTLGSLLKKVEHCGQYSMFFCIQQSKQDTESKMIKTPNISINLPCSSDIFKSNSLALSKKVDGCTSLTLQASPLVKAMHISGTRGCSSDEPWEPFSKTRSLCPLPWPNQEKGKATVYVKFRESLFNTESTCLSQTIEVGEPAAATPESAIQIARGAPYTTSQDVDISFAAIHASEMSLTKSEDCSGEENWQSYVDTISGYHIEQGDGLVALSVRFRDASGNVSPCFNDTIVYDSQPPKTPQLLDYEKNTNSHSLRLSWEASSDAGSGLKHYEVAIGSAKGQADIYPWRAVGAATATEITGLKLSDKQTYYAYVRASDAAGLSSTSQGAAFVAHDIPIQEARIALAWTATCAIASNSASKGKVKCWGRNSVDNNGQITGYAPLGQGSTDSISDQRLVPYINLGSDRTARALAASSSSVCALLDDGTVKCWGENGAGQLGQGNSTPVGRNSADEIAKLDPVYFGPGRTVVQLSAGMGASFCALLDNAEVKCWGDNKFGQLGQGSSAAALGLGADDMKNLKSINLGTDRYALEVSVGDGHACAVLDNGQAKCWGRNDFGQLGLGFTSNIGSAPDAMANLQAINLGVGRTAKHISVGSASQTCVVLDTGDAKCWGAKGSDLRLGQDSSDHIGKVSADEVADLAALNLGSGNRADKIYAFHRLGCVILSQDSADSGKAKCWGYNEFGQLGIGSTSRSISAAASTLMSFDGDKKVKALSQQWAAVCAVLENDEVVCWGANEYHHLGQGLESNVRYNSTAELSPVDLDTVPFNATP